jgi:rare lipoprotein A
MRNQNTNNNIHCSKYQSLGAVRLLLSGLLCMSVLVSCTSSQRFASVRIPESSQSGSKSQSQQAQQSPQEKATPGSIIRGYASFYGDEFHGRLTSNGEVFSQELLTAAHKTLPFGTKLKVTNTKNKRSVIVRVNDRGPFVDGRVLDLSRAAAERIDMKNEGVAFVSITVME